MQMPYRPLMGPVPIGLLLCMGCCATDVASGEPDDDDTSVERATYVYVSTGGTLFLLVFIFSARLGWLRMQRMYSPLALVSWLLLSILFPPFLFVFLVFALLGTQRDDADLSNSTIDAHASQTPAVERPRTLSQQERRTHSSITVYNM